MATTANALIQNKLKKKNATEVQEIKVKKQKNVIEDDGEWNIDSYRTEYESEEHWELRKRFMEVHKDKFPEDRLVCLARVFTNMEFMGCRYPSETMRLVAELSKDVAKDFRESRESRLKRTFVAASDAAEQRAKGRRINKTAQSKQQKTQQQRPQFKTNTLLNSEQFADLFKGLRFDKFVVFLIGGRNCLNISAQRSDMTIEEREVVMENGAKQIEMYVGEKFVAKGMMENLKASKSEAFNQALQVLQKHCYTIKSNKTADKIKIEKTKDNKVICEILKEQKEEEKLGESNIGFKMMKKMGWTGGGLGSSNQGKEDPVAYLIKNNRAGLGNQSGGLSRQYLTQMLDNYVKSEDIRELKFEASFTKEQRAMLHEIAGKYHLKSNSYGKDDQRHLIISKRTTNEQILCEILLNKNPIYSGQYFVQVPESKTSTFPEHATTLELDL